jgi:hypothetical protein
MMTSDDQQAFDIATSDVREFIQRAKQLVTEEMPRPRMDSQEELLVINVANLIGDQYRSYCSSVVADIAIEIGALRDSMAELARRERREQHEDRQRNPVAPPQR